MTSLESKIKKLINSFLVALLFTFLSLVVVETIHLTDSKREFLLKNAEEKLVELEITIDNQLKMFSMDLEYLVNDIHFNEFVLSDKSGAEIIKHDFMFVMGSNDPMFSLALVDDFGIVTLRIEKTSQGEIRDTTKTETLMSPCDCYLEDATDRKKTFFMLSHKLVIDRFNHETIIPILTAYLPVRDEEKMIGVVVAQYNAREFLKRISYLDLFDITVYDNTAKVLYDNSIHLQDYRDITLLDNHFDYKRMISSVPYNNGDSVSKLLDLNYDVVNEMGIQLRLNENYEKEISGITNHLYHFYTLVVLSLLIFLGIVARKYVTDSSKYESLQKYSEWLQMKNEQLMEESMIDKLTGIGNTKRYEERAAELFDTYQRYGHDFSMFVFNIDNMKHINKKFGEKIGDDIIKTITENVRTFIRKSDIFVRYSGAEFVVLLPHTNRKFSHKFAKKMIDYVSGLDYNIGETSLVLTISAGIDTIEKTDETVDALFKRASGCMKKAKTMGKNTVFYKQLTMNEMEKDDES